MYVPPIFTCESLAQHIMPTFHRNSQDFLIIQKEDKYALGYKLLKNWLKCPISDANINCRIIKIDKNLRIRKMTCLKMRYTKVLH